MTAANGAVRSSLAADLAADLMADLHRPVEALDRRATPTLRLELTVTPLAWRPPGVSVAGGRASLACGPVRLSCSLDDPRIDSLG